VCVRLSNTQTSTPERASFERTVFLYYCSLYIHPMGNLCFGGRKNESYVIGGGVSTPRIDNLVPKGAWEPEKVSNGEAEKLHRKVSPYGDELGDAHRGTKSPFTNEAQSISTSATTTTAVVQDVRGSASDKDVPVVEERITKQEHQEEVLKEEEGADLGGIEDAEAKEEEKEEEEEDEFAHVEEADWFDAVERRLLLTMRWRIERKAQDADCINIVQQKRTALHICASDGWLQGAQYLVHHARVDLSITDKLRRTALHCASTPAMVEFLCESFPAKLRLAGDLWKKTALHVAVEEKRRECYEALCGRKAGRELVELGDRAGDTIFHYASRMDATPEDLAFVGRIFQDFEPTTMGSRTNNEGKSALDCVKGHANNINADNTDKNSNNNINELGFLLVRAGCKFVKRKLPNIIEPMRTNEAYVVDYMFRHAPYHGETNKVNLLRAANEHLSDSARRNCVDTVKVLLSHKVDVNYCGPMMQGTINAASPLLEAAASGHGEMFDLLLQAKADIKAVDMFDRTCLYLSLMHGHKDLSMHLLESHPDLKDVLDTGGRSVAHAAAIGGLVLDLPETEHKEDWEGWCPWHLAAEQGHLHVLEAMSLNDDELFQTLDFGISVVHLAAENGRANILEFLKTRAGCDVNLPRMSDGKTPWLLAATHDHVECLQVLGSANFLSSADRNGRDALHLCGPLCAQWLLDCGADIHFRDAIQWTPLHSAAAEGKLEVVDILLKAKADVTLVDEEGKDAKACALLRGQLHVIPRLDRRLDGKY